MNLKPIGKAIKKYRQLHGLRQEQLAEMSGLSTNYIGMLERGEKTPSLETFLTIATSLAVSADMLLEDILYNGYRVKDSLLSDKLNCISTKDREKIYDVIDVMIKHSETKNPGKAGDR